MVGTGKYSDEQICFIITAKRQGATNSEIVRAFRQRWVFHDFGTGGVKYIVNKYQANPNYNGDVTSGGTIPAPMPQQYQAPGPAQMMMHPQHAQGPAQMMMHTQHLQGPAQMMIHPQQPRGFAQSMIHSQPPQGRTQTMMGVPQPYGSPQGMMRSPQSHGAPHPMMQAQQGVGSNITNDQLLAFAQSFMNPMQFLAFAQALVQPQGSGLATSQQPLQASSTPGMSTQPLNGSSAPGMTPEQSHGSTSPGNSPGQLHGASPMTSTQQLQRPSTPAMSEAQQVGNPAQLMSPQRSQDSPRGIASLPQTHGYTQSYIQGYTQGYTQGMPAQQSWYSPQAIMASQQSQGLTQGMPGQQSWYSPQAIIANQQTQGPTHGLMAHQQVAPPAVNQTMVSGLRLQPATADLVSQSTDEAGTTLMKPTPYLGVIPPARPRFQSGQLGMISNFVTRSPLAPIASPEHRVVKNSTKKPGVQLQLPISPISPPKHVTGEGGDAEATKARPQKEDLMEKELHDMLEAALEKDNLDKMDVVTPAIATEVDALFEDSPVIGNSFANPSMVNVPFEPTSEAHITALMAPEPGALFVEDSGTEVATEAAVPVKNYQTQLQVREAAYAQAVRSLFERDSPPPPMDNNFSAQYFTNEFPDWVNYNTDATTLEGFFSPRVPLAPAAPIAPVTPEVEEMTSEEQYAYGIRQGLPNKGVRGDCHQ